MDSKYSAGDIIKAAILVIGLLLVVVFVATLVRIFLYIGIAVIVIVTVIHLLSRFRKGSSD